MGLTIHTPIKWQNKINVMVLTIKIRIVLECNTNKAFCFPVITHLPFGIPVAIQYSHTIAIAYFSILIALIPVSIIGISSSGWVYIQVLYHPADNIALVIQQSYSLNHCSETTLIMGSERKGKEMMKGNDERKGKEMMKGKDGIG